MSDPPVRIAYVINSVEGGGAALPVPALAGVFRSAGAAVKLFALTRRDGRAIPPLEHAGIDFAVRSGGERDHPAALRWLDAEVARWRPTHLVTSLTRATLLGQLVGLRRRLPVASWQHAVWLRPGNLRLLRLSWRLSRLWIADSEAVARFCRERIGIDGTRVAVWPIFRADSDRPVAEPWSPGEPLRLGSLGRLHAVKGYDVAIGALARLAAGGLPLRLEVRGEGSERAALTALAASAGVELALPGYVDDAPTWLARQHLYLQPSRSEGFCVAAHQAMLAGLPVIGSAVGEMARSIVPGVTGWAVAPGNVDALAGAIAAAVADPPRLARMGGEARARVLASYRSDAFNAAGLAVVSRLRAMG